MTCLQKYKQEHGPDAKIIDGQCPNDYGYLPRPKYCYCDGTSKYCEECWNREIPELIDIHKIIDDAMKKKNRSVFIHISPQFGTTIRVEPYDPTPKKWIRDDNHNIICPECGRNLGLFRSEPSYCPLCGEKLAQSTLKNFNEEEEK